MSPLEVGLGLASVSCSTGSQLLMKAAAQASERGRRYGRLALAVAGQLVSVLLVVLLMRTLALSLLVCFAALAYIVVPLSSQLIFGERLPPRFWLGASLVSAGTVCISLAM